VFMVGGAARRATGTARYHEAVLLFGPGGESLDAARERLAGAGFLPVTSGDADEAIADMHRFAFDALVVSSRVERPLRERMVGAYRALRPGGRVIEFDGRPRLLLASVRRAFAAPL
jgi:hypothetical protein